MGTVGIDSRYLAVDLDEKYFAAFDAIDFGFDFVKFFEISKSTGRLQAEFLSHDTWSLGEESDWG